MADILVNTIKETRERVARARAEGQRIGLVPTMGALHEGHLSLIRAARAECGFVVASIFVNPTQFGPHEDLARYPRPLERDLELCQREGVDLAFVPEAAVMYPEGACTYVEVHDLQDGLCGASRPHHFRGVCTIVLKLFNIVRPDLAYFGQKDAQQARIIGQMIRDLDVPVELRVCPIVRESDGLALSSRNQYLDADQRRHALVLSQSLSETQQAFQAGARDAGKLRDNLHARVQGTPGAELDYAEIVDAVTLQPIARIDRPALVALAVKFGPTRLIDNLTLAPPD